MNYAYVCPTHGVFDVPIPADSCLCPDCGDPSRRIYGSFAFDRRAVKDQARWDPVVGAYVRNDREFREMLKAGQAREEAEIGMECKLQPVDARDNEGLAELHGHQVDHRLEQKELADRSRHDTKVEANHEEKPKVLIA